jgi:asparagine synthase (glutamine-hydrolysing)
MCGVVGAFVFNGSDFRIEEDYLIRMRDAMAHRGPDGSGFWISDDRRVGLAHRRLSIIDLSESASQPMSNEDGSLWTSFNGEIYNHAEIRAELEKIGQHRWKTSHSDTEMILHAFEQWGIDCLERFRGMFAIAIWDVKSRELWLIRDRIGIKPMYFSIHDGRITFASEIKALLKDPDQKRAVNEESLFHYFTFLTSPAPDTLFQGIRKLPAGSWMRIKEDGTIREERYWDLWDHVKPLTGISEDEIASMVLEELRVAVELRKVGDVPVGVFLSGGIDSSTNAALFSEGEGEPVKTFSISYQGNYESYPSELKYARQMASLVGADHHEKLLSIDDLVDFLPEMVRLQDEPLSDPVCVPLYYVSKLARENGVTVCQAGEGSDEIFIGYEKWRKIFRLQGMDDWPIPKWLKRPGLPLLTLLGKQDSVAYELLRRAAQGVPIFWSGSDGFAETPKQRLFSTRLKKRFDSLDSWDVLAPIRRRFDEKAWDRSHLNWMSYLDLNLRLPELLLMRIDKMSMGVALEARVPFLDHKFVELVMGIPESVKFKNQTLKHILKESVNGLIPDELVHRKKQGFGVPVEEWFFDRLGQETRSVLNDLCKETDYFDRAELDRVLDKGTAKQGWHLLNFALWWKEYISS